MSDLATLLTLVAGAITALVAIIAKARGRGAREATERLKENEVKHAQSISDAVAAARADRRSPADPDQPAGVRPADPFAKRGWRD